MSDIGLTQFLKDYFATPRRFCFGTDDCSIGMVSSWIKERTGVDPSLPYLDKYWSSIDAKNLLNDKKGLIEIAKSIAEDLGLHETVDPLTGDIGIVNGHTVDGGFSQIMAIRNGNLWCVRVAKGLLASECKAMIAWRLP